MVHIRTRPLYLAILRAAALFGFYFTMSVAIMPGFDRTVPFAALQANQDIGRATQQSTFFVSLVGTPVLLVVAVIVVWRVRPKYRMLRFNPTAASGSEQPLAMPQHKGRT